MCIWVCARAYESCCCLSISGCINLAFKIHSGAVLFVTWNDFSMATTLVSPVINCLSLYLPLVAIWLVKPRCSRPPCETTLIFEAAICILLPPVSNLLQAPGPCVFFFSSLETLSLQLNQIFLGLRSQLPGYSEISKSDSLPPLCSSHPQHFISVHCHLSKMWVIIRHSSQGSPS